MEEVEFEVDGKSLVANLKRPKKTKQKLPIVYLFGGFKHAADVLELVDPERDVLLASFDYPFGKRERFRFPQSLMLASRAKKAIMQTLAGIPRLQEILSQRKDVEVKKTVIIGASFGSPFAALTAAAHPEFNGVAIVHGFGDIAAVAQHQFMRRWRADYGNWATPLAWILSQTATLYLNLPDPGAALERLRPSQKLLVISATDDSFIPPASLHALWRGYQRSPAQKEKVLLTGDHVQPGRTGVIQDLMNRVTRWMNRVY